MWRRSALGIAVLLAGGLPGQEIPQATQQHGAFAFPDTAGKRLLTIAVVPKPELLHTALCSGGRRLSVRYERRQSERENNGRHYSGNFEKLAGDVFAVLQGTVDEAGTCFLASDSLLASASAVPITLVAPKAGCEGALRQRFASERKRDVVHCWPVGILPSASLVAVEFARQSREALASLVLTEGNKSIFADYTATFKGEGRDLWRVDDGGVMAPEDFHVVFVLHREGSYTMAVNWGGGEGANLALFVSNGGRFQKVAQDYWYRSPL